MIECPECGGQLYPTRHYVRLDCQDCDNWEPIPEPDEEADR